MLTVLITGFGPFPGAPFNPTADLAKALARRRRPAFDGLMRIGHIFATRYDAVDEELPSLLARHRPRILLMFGLAARTPYLRIETRARNARSLLFPDVAGGVSARMAIAPGKAPALRGVSPFPALLAACRQARVPVRLSRDAGRYLCNYLYWRALDADPHVRPNVIVFVHVPKIRRSPRRLGRQKAVTSDDLVRAGDAVLRVLAAAARGARR